MSTHNSTRVIIVTSIHPDFDKRVWRHARGLAELGYEVTLVCPWKADYDSVIDGVRLLTFEFRKTIYSRIFLTPVRILRELRKLGKSSGIVHFHDFDLLPWMAFLSFFRTVVYDVHENYPDEVRNRSWVPRFLHGVAYHAIKWGQWILARLIRNIVLVTPYQESSFPGKGFNKIYVKNFASRKLLDSVRSDYKARDPIIVFVGAQHENNGSFLMLDIADLCRKQGVECRFIAPDLFAQREVKNKYLGIISERNLSGYVELFDPVAPQDIMLVLNKARIAINPNLRVEQQIKGIHTKMYEFMAAGLPIVASDLPHQKELIEMSGAGYALPPESPATFVEKIRYLLENKSTACEIGMHAQEVFANNFTWEGEIQKLADYYARISDCR